MNLRILLFAGLAETCGSTFLEVELPAFCSVLEMKNILIQTYPMLETATYRVAVNSAYVEEDFQLNDGAEIAFIPPVSGG